jgi:predicted esterase
VRALTGLRLCGLLLWMLGTSRAEPPGAAPQLSAGGSAAAPTGLREAVFTEYSPLSDTREIVRRLLTPLAGAEVEQRLAHADQALVAQSIDLRDERFIVYVPARAPPAGYALLVFVPPWNTARLPEGWDAVLDRAQIIFVSAARSGNDANVLGRRVPLALLAAENILRQYPVDRERIYVGGFSGGARVALRLALGYPDVFRGAFLNAGSDPIGDGPDSPPPRDLLVRFQQSSRLILVTGERDLDVLAGDAVSLRSMHAWCVTAERQVTPRAGHDIASSTVLAGALARLLDQAPRATPDPALCRAALERDLDRQLAAVQSLLDKGQRAEARRLLLRIDAHFGGLAAPRSLELLSRLK